MRRARLARWVVLGAWLVVSLWGVSPAEAEEEARGLAVRMWEQLVEGASSLRLPVGFLKTMPPGFVQFEFEDLKTYAAEYHPGEHRLVLNRSLSFHAAGRDLRPLHTMTSKELEVLYHELFHAYMDFLESREGAGGGSGSEGGLLAFARTMQACRYGDVAITPLVQRRQEIDQRYLSESEAWEALNETWAVFVGWAIWHQLEVEKKGKRPMVSTPLLADQWRARLGRALRSGELRGYYVPQDPDERRVAQKRFLAPQSGISPDEIREILLQVMEFPQKFVDGSLQALESDQKSAPRPGCVAG